MKRGGWYWKKGKTGGCLGSPNVVVESHEHWGCRKSEEKRMFRGAADKGELKRLSVMGGAKEPP